VVTLAGGGLLRGTNAAAPAVSVANVPIPVRSMFTPHVGSSFTLRAESGRAVSARLVAVQDLRQGRAGDEDAFGLLLHAARGDRLEQSVARIEHPMVQTLPLLVSPAGTGAAGQDYSIVVNRASSLQL
jgi:hypothetical protein